MLSRSADNLFWMARYIERAEATARLLVMGQRMALLPGAHHRDEWRSVLRVAGCEHMIGEHALVSEADAVRLLVLDEDNPASIRASLGRARSNGRAVRTQLTQDMWEALNDGWRLLESYDLADARRELPQLIDWAKARSASFRGAVSTGMLRNDAHDFLRIGGAIERANMTLRLLDVKYHVLLPETEVVGGGRDHYQWNSVLDALSGKRAFHHVYGGQLRPWLITEFLVRNHIFPRSLAFCVAQIGYHLDRLANTHDARHACHKTASAMLEQLDGAREGAIFEAGLHEFVGRSLADINRLSREIAAAYHF
jgi:uncharacterized alpha-E superfamily protein